jgi:ethanolamine utilization protein EutA
VGAAEYTVQVSGNTIHVDPPSVLPLRNLRVVRPRLSLPEVINPVAVADQMRTHLAVQGHDPATPVAIALDFTGDPSFPRLRALAAGLYAARAEVVSGGGLLCLVFDHDVAQLIGRQLRPLLEEADTSGPLVVIDGVILADLDFIDISAVMPDSGAVAITVKSLLFGL